MQKFNAWIVKNKWGSFLIWTVDWRKKDVIEKIGKEKWPEWRKQGHRLVKIKFLEVA